MAWPIAAILILAALAGCWVACAAAQVAWAERSLALWGVATAVLVSLTAEGAALNGSAPAGRPGGPGGDFLPLLLNRGRGHRGWWVLAVATAVPLWVGVGVGLSTPESHPFASLLVLGVGVP